MQIGVDIIEIDRIKKACGRKNFINRFFTLKELEDITSSVEKELRSNGISEVKSEAIGEMVMDRLVKIDDVAYVRFASVYRQFKDINVFIDELKELIKKEK